LEFGALIEALIPEIHNVKFVRGKGRHEAKGSWRPIIQFDVGGQTFDRFFNSPYGYRGRYLIAPAVGVEANSRALTALTGPLLQLATLAPPIAEEVRRSLLSQYAKVWIDEDQDIPRGPDLIIEIQVPTWVAAATAARKRLDDHDCTITDKEVDRIYGVRAPIGTRLEVKGAWIGSDGSLTVVSSKISRALDINAYGIS
jgi:hypothetical protein